MFREGNHIAYVSKGFGGLHDISADRISKSSFYTKDARDIKKEIEKLKFDIYSLEKKEKRNKLSKEESEVLLSKRNDLAFWISEMSKFDNLPSHKRLKTSKKKIKKDKLKPLVLGIIEEAVSQDKYFVEKEDIARKLNVRVKDLDKIFMELNREGILSQAEHRLIHDSNRGFEPLLPFEKGDWGADIYYIR